MSVFPYLSALVLSLALQSADPRGAVRELLAADRAFSATAATMDLPEALAAMFAEDVLMPGPEGAFVEGRVAALEALRANPANQGARASWTPIRGGVSADGLHGFTLGYMEIVGGDGSQRSAKYLAYWVRGGEGWRVAGYKRAPRPAGEVSLEPLAPALPRRPVAPSSDPARRTALEESLRATEQAFSDRAQAVGLGPAFLEFGSPDATNMGGPDSPSFLVGAAEIAAGVGGADDPSPSPVSWSADRALVASSGDLGITFGRIRPNQPAPGQAGFPFFTIWWRDGPGEPWRYIAE